jgi:hypothetical protein
MEPRMNNYLKHALSIVVGAFVLLWIALLNGQPFFFRDTTNYIRVPDAAIVTLLGPRFATSWTGAEVLNARGAQSASAGSNLVPPVTEPLPNSTGEALQSKSTNSLKEGVVLAGRSPYYGMLLYLGELAGDLWLTVFVQALVVAYLAFVLIVRCLGSSMRSYALSIGCIACFSTVPYYVGFLMPDIFAGATILTTSMLLAFWDRLTRHERVTLAMILAYSIMCHTTHLLICVAIVAVYTFVSVFTKFQSQSFRVGSLATIAICILTGVLGELAFSIVISRMIGFPPTRPPFITARLVELGPGYQYLIAHCLDHVFAVCQFLDRLPLAADTFIWGHENTNSVFASAPAETKRALGSEQFAFLLNVLLFDPVGVLVSALREGWNQLVTFGLAEFNYCSGCGLSSFGDLPAKYEIILRNTLVFRNIWPVVTFEMVYRAAVILALVSIIAIAVIFFVQRSRRHAFFHLQIQSIPAWLFVGAGVGIVSNAFICGLFSAIHDRYEARVIWLIPLLAMALLTRVHRQSPAPSVSGAVSNRTSVGATGMEDTMRGIRTAK